MSMPQAVLTEDRDAASASGPSLASGFTLRDFLIATFFHLRIVLLAAVLPLTLAVAAAVTDRTEYTASSLLLVIVSREVSNASQNITDSGPSILTIEGLKQVESEVQILESADVVRTTIEQIGLDRLYPPGRLSALTRLFASSDSVMDKAIVRFRKNLHVSVLSDSNVIEVGFTNPDRALSVEATNALVRNYLAARRKVMENPTGRILMAEVDRFKGDLAQVDKDIEALKNKAGIIEFSQDAILAANQMDAVVQRRRQLAERRVAVAAQIKEAERQLKDLPEQVFDFTQKSDAVANDDDTNILTKLLLERDRLKAQYAPNSPLLRNVENSIATVREKIRTRNQRLYSTDRDVRNPSLSYLQNMLLSLKVELDALDRQQSELTEQEQFAEKRLTSLRATEPRLIELNRRRDSLNEGYREYLRRAVAANIEEAAAKHRQSNVRVVQEAGASVTSRNLALPFLAAGIFGGLLFGAAAGAIASVLRTTFIMPSEAERALRLPALAAFDAPDSDRRTAQSEAELSGLATLLLDTRVDDEPLQMIHFLAAQKDEEVPILCLRLAEEFATHRGRRTLFVDLCSSLPDHPFGTPHEMKGGLAVTRTVVPQLWSAVQMERSPLLDVRLPLADGTRMRDELRQSFDCVVICSLMQGSFVVTDRLNQLADGNVLLIRSESTRKPAAVNMVDSVVESGGALLGFVFFDRHYYVPDWLYKRA